MYACAITGHRLLDENLNREVVKDKLRDLIKEQGFSDFYCGMALGFDTLCFHILEELKKEGFSLRVIACIPFEGQADRFSQEKKKIYYDLLKKADEVHVLSSEYTKYCMFVRDRFMVDRADAVFCYLRQEKSGTGYTVSYAVKKGKKIFEV